ncbi:MAG: hypothetical protein QUS08_03440, partial [Methanothrix sp.]|nr:hypothetical protein [Methanothrix sp.]
MRILPLAADASLLNLQAPGEVEVCGSYPCRVTFESGSDATGISASLVLPEGLHYEGGSKVLFGGREALCDPVIDGQTLRWSLGHP